MNNTPNDELLAREKVYLGDSVYCQFYDTGKLLLTTENGFSQNNTIYLDHDIFEALLKYAIRVGFYEEKVK